MTIKKLISIILSLVMLSSLYIDVSADIVPNLFNLVQGQFYTSLETDGKYLYAGHTGKGVYIIDAKNPDNIELAAIAECDFVNDRGIAVLGKYLYAQDANSVLVFDIKNPLKPKKVGSAGITEGGRSMSVHKDMLAVAGMRMFSFYDISDPKNITLVSTIANPNPAYHSNIYLTDGYAYFVDSKYNFSVIDLTNPEEPTIAKTLQMPADSPDYNQIYYTAMIGDFFYFASETERGLWAVDCRNPVEPELIGKYSTLATGNSVTTNGKELYFAGYEHFAKYNIDENGVPVLEFDKYVKEAVVSDIVVLQNRYIMYGNQSLICSIDMNGKVDTKGLPQPMTESEFFGEDDEEIKLPFEDIVDHWAKEYIADMYKRQFVRGINETEFDPDRKMNRAEFATLLINILAADIEQYRGEFTDVSADSWYSDIMYTAAKNEFLPVDTIKNNKARPTEAISREEMAKSIVTLFDIAGVELPSGEKISITDADAASDWAKESVRAICKSGIMSGDDNSLFNPQDGATRAEVTKVLSKAISNLFGTYEEPVFLDNSKNDIENNISSEFDKFIATERMPYNTQAPQIIKISDAISADELFNIYGEGLNLDCKVYITPAEQGVEHFDEKTATECSVIGTDEDGTEHYIVCETPKNIKNGAYAVWVSNESGFANPVYLNGARPQWIDRVEAAKGQKMRILGKNLDGREFGAELATSVAFIKDGKATNGKIISINPYCVEVMPPEDIEAGEYEIAVTNDGILWFAPEDDKTIVVKDEVYDPYSLNVPWADRFDYTVKADITKEPYNAPTDGRINISDILQKAIDDVKAQGGGVVYIPEGRYKAAAIEIPADVILEGAGMEKTIIEYSNIVHIDSDFEAQHLGNFMFHSKGDGITEGRQGIYNFQIGLDTSCMAPDHYIWFGSVNWGPEVNDWRLRTNEYVFVKKIKLNTPMLFKDGDGRAYGVVQMIRSHYLLDDCIMYGSFSTPTSQCVGEYSYNINNHIDSTIGNQCMLGTRFILEKNTMNRHFKFSTVLAATQGSFMRGYTYATENVIRGTGIPGCNDGELLCVETYRGGTKLRGNVLSSEADSLTYDVMSVEGEGLDASSNYSDPYNVKSSAYGDWHIQIVKGKGMGQYRKVESIDKEAGIIYLDDKEWDVLPDETSKFAISLPLNNVVFYNNYANTGAKGFWLYGDAWDCVVAKNYGVNVEGAYGYTSTGGDAGTADITNFFSRFEGNVFQGYSSKTENCGIGTNAGMESTSADKILVYGPEIKDNEMTGGEKQGDGIDLTEAPAHDGIYFGTTLRRANTSTMNTTKGAIAQGNIVRDMKTGISVAPQDPAFPYVPTRSYTDSVYCKGNSFKNVETEYYDPFGKVVIVE